jgi:hypothetical protein
MPVSMAAVVMVMVVVVVVAAVAEDRRSPCPGPDRARSLERVERRL